MSRVTKCTHLEASPGDDDDDDDDDYDDLLIQDTTEDILKPEEPCQTCPTDCQDC